MGAVGRIAIAVEVASAAVVASQSSNFRYLEAPGKSGTARCHPIHFIQQGSPIMMAKLAGILCWVEIAAKYTRTGCQQVGCHIMILLRKRVAVA